jgi:hypothetical protein
MCLFEKKVCHRGEGMPGLTPRPYRRVTAERPAAERPAAEQPAAERPAAERLPQVLLKRASVTSEPRVDRTPPPPLTTVSSSIDFDCSV